MLVKELKAHYPDHEYLLFTPRFQRNPETSCFLTEGFERISPAYLPGWFWRSFIMKRDIAHAALDIYHGLSNELPYGIRTTNTRSIVTILDLIFRFYPEDYPWIDRQVYEAKVRYACEKAHRIIAVSQSTKSDIMTYYGVPEKKIAVVHLTCDDRFRRNVSNDAIDGALSKYGLPRHYLLYVGTINCRKNLLAIAQAMKQINGIVPLPLVVVGNGKDYKRKVQKYVSNNGIEDRVLFAPPIAADDLPALYRRSSIVVFPSRYEGFGLPIIEALYCRVPVITTRMSSLPEVAGPGAFYADPDKPESIAEGIVKIVNSPDYARQLIDDGYRHVLQFNPQVVSKKLMTVYEETMASA
ncbi:MAG: glycosyltransferase family 4 protein [Chitinispirillaceae bacterium]|nr:glycosyltransferase family 4 protein [Chitinispirillaceae bacterium]